MDTHPHRPLQFARRAAVAALALAAAGPSTATIIAGPFVNPANGHTYYLLDTETWQASEIEARTHACTLVQIANQAENDWVYDTFDSILPRDSSCLWLGINDVVTEGTFVWSDGEPVTYTNWSDTMPDNARGNENYGMMWGHNTGQPQALRQWNDLANSFPGIYCFGVIETYDALPPPPPPDPGVVPEPASLAALGLGALGILKRRKKA